METSYGIEFRPRAYGHRHRPSMPLLPYYPSNNSSSNGNTPLTTENNDNKLIQTQAVSLDSINISNLNNNKSFNIPVDSSTNVNNNIISNQNLIKNNVDGNNVNANGNKQDGLKKIDRTALTSALNRNAKKVNNNASNTQECVDYLSYDFDTFDLHQCWRNATKSRNFVQNGRRLENASWRRFFQLKFHLRTIDPSDLNWEKDSDVCWLYGPFHVYQPLAVLQAKYAESNNFDSVSGQNVSLKSALKKRTQKEFLANMMKDIYPKVDQVVSKYSNNDDLIDIPKSKTFANNLNNNSDLDNSTLDNKSEINKNSNDKLNLRNDSLEFANGNRNTMVRHSVGFTDDIDFGIDSHSSNLPHQCAFSESSNDPLADSAPNNNTIQHVVRNASMLGMDPESFSDPLSKHARFFLNENFDDNTSNKNINTTSRKISGTSLASNSSFSNLNNANNSLTPGQSPGRYSQKSSNKQLRFAPVSPDSSLTTSNGNSPKLLSPSNQTKMDKRKNKSKSKNKKSKNVNSKEDDIAKLDNLDIKKSEDENKAIITDTMIKKPSAIFSASDSSDGGEDEEVDDIIEMSSEFQTKNPLFLNDSEDSDDEDSDIVNHGTFDVDITRGFAGRGKKGIWPSQIMVRNHSFAGLPSRKHSDEINHHADSISPSSTISTNDSLLYNHPSNMSFSSFNSNSTIGNVVSSSILYKDVNVNDGDKFNGNNNNSIDSDNIVTIKRTKSLDRGINSLLMMSNTNETTTTATTTTTTNKAHISQVNVSSSNSIISNSNDRMNDDNNNKNLLLNQPGSVQLLYEDYNDDPLTWTEISTVVAKGIWKGVKSFWRPSSLVE